MVSFNVSIETPYFPKDRSSCAGSMTAARAEAIELETVGCDRKTVPRGDFFLKALDVAVLKLHDLSAAGANEVVMVALVRHIVVLGLRAKVPSLGQAGLTKEIERAVNGGQPQVRIFSRQLMIHFFSRDVLLLQKGIENQFTLPRKFELMLP